VKHHAVNHNVSSYNKALYYLSELSKILCCNTQSKTSAKRDGDNTAVVRSNELAFVNELSFPIPNDYTEPLFDDQHRLELVNDDYSIPYDDMTIRRPFQKDAVNKENHQRSQSFVQPATNLDLLFVQIKETCTMEISSENIWYGQ